MGFCSRKINTTRSSATMKAILLLLLLVSVKRKITENRVRNVAGHFLTVSESWSVCSDLVERKMIPIAPRRYLGKLYRLILWRATAAVR